MIRALIFTMSAFASLAVTGTAHAASATAISLADVALPIDTYREVYSKTCPSSMSGQLKNSPQGATLYTAHPAAFSAGVAAACAESDKLRSDELPSFKNDLADFYDGHFSPGELKSINDHFHTPFATSMTHMMFAQAQKADYSQLNARAMETGQLDPTAFQQLMANNMRAVHAQEAKLLTPAVVSEVTTFADSAAGKKWAASGPDMMAMMSGWFARLQQQNGPKVSSALQSAVAAHLQSEGSKP